ncbi:MAG: FKBP-type peptidyl-prolyl cis-trans isomerase [Flavobacteriales bacterium]|nr:FKBP-type peptidyl-prolyl cis-trans isomerase [Flavobacteriales bacterium]MCB9167889.1 FKBP-type peptidyl-prolyl cis-trans isomerase [Flavobacteriales bacterium]
MRTRTTFLALLAILVSACTNQVTGQKERSAALVNNVDSVSYGIGTDIGHNMRSSGMDSLNVEAMAQGIRDGLDSTERFDMEAVRPLIQAYMLEAQKKVMAKEQAEAEGNLRKGEEWLAENGKKAGVVTTESGLQYEVLQAGKGPKPQAADKVTVNYKGTLIDGTEFDSSYKHGQPATFGVSQVIPGWTEALMMMQEGARWKLYVPSGLAYGNSRGPGGKLPANSVLIFEVELLKVNPEQGGAQGQ